jgi:hypothetical protein
MHVRGQHAVGAGGGAAAGDGGGDSVGIDRRLELGEDMGVVPDMGRRVVMHRGCGSMVRRRVQSTVTRFTGGERPPVVDRGW